MTNSALSLLNLACIKHTGQTLPQSCLLETDWKYVRVNGKKVAVWSPSPLANPLRVSYPNDDIEHKILRRVVVSELDYTFNRVPKDIMEAKLDIAVWFIIGQYKIISTPYPECRAFVAPWIQTLYKDCEQHPSFNKSLKWWNEQVKLANEFGMEGRDAYYHIYSLVGFKVECLKGLIETSQFLEIFKDYKAVEIDVDYGVVCVKLFAKIMSGEFSDIRVNIKQTKPKYLQHPSQQYSAMFAPFRASQGFVKLLSINHRLPIFDSILRMKGGLRSHQIYERFFAIPNSKPNGRTSPADANGYLDGGTQDGTFHTQLPSYNPCYGRHVGMVRRHEIDRYLVQRKFATVPSGGSFPDIITQSDEIRKSKKAVKGYYEVLMTVIANSLNDNSYRILTIQNGMISRTPTTSGSDSSWRKYNNFRHKGKSAKDWLETDWNEPLSPEILMRVFNPNKKLQKERINEKLIDWFHTPN